MNMIKKDKTNKKKLSTPPIESTTLNKDDLKSFEEFIKKLNVTKKRDNTDISQLNNILREYTNSYLLIAYNVNNEAIVASMTNNQKDMNALTELLRKVFFDIINNNDNED